MLCGDEHRVHVVRDDVRRAYANRDAASDGGDGPALVRPSNVDDFRCRVWRLFEARAFYHERRGVPLNEQHGVAWLVRDRILRCLLVKPKRVRAINMAVTKLQSSRNRGRSQP